MRDKKGTSDTTPFNKVLFYNNFYSAISKKPRHEQREVITETKSNELRNQNTKSPPPFEKITIRTPIKRLKQNPYYRL